MLREAPVTRAVFPVSSLSTNRSFRNFSFFGEIQSSSIIEPRLDCRRFYLLWYASICCQTLAASGGFFDASKHLEVTRFQPAHAAAQGPWLDRLAGLERQIRSDP